MAELYEPRGLDGNCEQIALDEHNRVALEAEGLVPTRNGIGDHIAVLAGVGEDLEIDGSADVEVPAGKARAVLTDTPGAPRVVTLPPWATGRKRIRIIDAVGGCSAAIYLLIVPQIGETLNGVGPTPGYPDPAYPEYPEAGGVPVDMPYGFVEVEKSPVEGEWVITARSSPVTQAELEALGFTSLYQALTMLASLRDK